MSTPSTSPVCPHGQLARQCRVCELEQEIADASLQLKMRDVALKDARDEVARLNDALLRASPQYTVWCGCGDEIIDDNGAECGACVSLNASKMKTLQQDNATLRADLHTERGNADLLTKRVHERDQELARMKRESKQEVGFTNSYIKQLHASESTIAVLRAALAQVMPVTCDDVHHDKRDRHGLDEPCPVLARAQAALGVGTGEGEE